MRRMVCGCLVITTILSAGAAWGAEKADVLARIDTARSGVEAFAAKARNNGTVVADIEAARSFVRKATQSFEMGKSLFGFGSVKPEVEQEISHFIGMADLNIALAESRLAKAKSQEELTALAPLLNKVKAKVKTFEARKSEMEKLRAEAAKAEALSRELAQLKTDKALLVSQVEMLMAERKQFDALREEKGEIVRKLEEAKAENRRLAAQVEKLTAQAVTAPPPLAVDKPRAVPAEKDFPAKELDVPSSVPARPAAVTKPAREELPAAPKVTGKEENPLSELVLPEKEVPAVPKAPTVEKLESERKVLLPVEEKKVNLEAELAPEKPAGEGASQPAGGAGPAASQSAPAKKSILE